jgi:hypothetical protein
MSFIKFELSDKDNGHHVYSQTLPDPEPGAFHFAEFKRDELMNTFKRFLEAVGYCFPDENDDDWKPDATYVTGFDPNR